MAINLTLKKKLHRPQVEACQVVPTTSAAGSLVASLTLPAYNIDFTVFAVNATSSLYLYNSAQDAYQLLPTVTNTSGTFGAGYCGKVVPFGPSGTALAGSTTTITIPFPLTRDLRGYSIRITSGPGAGDERIIASNTIAGGVSTATVFTPSTITVTTAFSAAITSSSVFQLITPRYWHLVPAATPGLSVYDWATNVWAVNKSVTNVTTAAALAFTGTDGVMESTFSMQGNIYDWSGALHTWNAATTNTLAINNVAYTTNQWQYGIITIIGGTGAGQCRAIASNTAATAGVSTLTTAANWTTPPDNTSVWILTKPLDSGGYTGLGGRAVFASFPATTAFSGTAAVTAATNIMTISGSPTGSLVLGMTISGTGIQNGTYIQAFGTGTGGVGTYVLSLPATSAGVAGTVTGGGSSNGGSATAPYVLTVTGTAWATNQWSNGYQLRVVAGTGIGTVAAINTNTATTLTLSTAAYSATNPLVSLDNTSVWIIEGNNDPLYVTGNAAVTLFKYSISQNTWTTIIPSVVGSFVCAGSNGVTTLNSNIITSGTLLNAYSQVLPYTTVTGTGVPANTYVLPYGSYGSTGTGSAGTYALSQPCTATASNINFTFSATRQAVTGAACSMSLAAGITDSVWASPDTSASNTFGIQNARFLYSFRGTSSALDRFDLSLGVWTSTLAYGNSGQSYATGTKYCWDGAGHIYIAGPTGYCSYYDVVRYALEPLIVINYPQGTALVGNTMWMTNIYEGPTNIPVLYHWKNTGQELFRCLLWTQPTQSLYPTFP